MKKPALLLAHTAILSVSLLAVSRAEEAPSTSAFTAAYFKQLESAVGKVEVRDGKIVNEVGGFFSTSISPTFRLDLDPKTGNRTIFNDGKNGPMSLFVFRSPPKLRQLFGHLDNILASGDLISKVPHSYVCCANGDYFLLLLSEEKKIPMDSEAVLTLYEMLPRAGPSYWKK